ncbi:hypothetical protein ACE1B4_13180 [Aeromonas veronii]|uniref:hypothetical protein n=1 Tax=Aeromonas veronii TaxID=654 RepID=UPI001116FE01|nr:hypothetical protein [Aeromonas veronii]TNI07610.1 hypothetical protein CF135_04960 [Aeromonas veronii]HDO1310417.1 hypothetical protein [Aeromonas veronii]
MKNGFIYPLIDKIVFFLKYTNLVELFKFIAKFYCEIKFKHSSDEEKTEQIITHCNIAIDVFQIFKWAILLFFWGCNFTEKSCEIIIWYFISSNLFTYFYYHVWGSNYAQHQTRESMNRRFVNTMLAISYYIASYAYLYQYHYFSQLKWADNKIDLINAIYLSIANSFTLAYEGFAPLTQDVRVVLISQTINTFLFFTIIIGNSIPNHFKGDK